jgi:hypothetical protein
VPWRYDPDYAGIAGYLKADPELRAELYRRAEMGLTVAKGSGSPTDGRTGRVRSRHR